MALHALGRRGLLLWVGDVLDASGIDASLQMSRLDLRADWQRIKLKAYERSHCVTYADRRSLHEVTEEMSGLTLGKRGGQIVARVSDKDREAHEKGHDWWPEMWGTNDDPDHKAIRIEFEFRRAGLVEFGVDTPEETLDRAT